MTGRGTSVRNQRGAAAVEFAILLPALLLIIAVVAGGARIWFARTTVQHVADSAARAASLARDAASAQHDADQLAHADLSAAALACLGGPSVVVDTSGFAVPVGQPARVSARVGCTVPLADLVLPGLPGVLFVEGSSTSTLDRYRGRR